MGRPLVTADTSEATAVVLAGGDALLVVAPGSEPPTPVPGWGTQGRLAILAGHLADPAVVSAAAEIAAEVFARDPHR